MIKIKTYHNISNLISFFVLLFTTMMALYVWNSISDVIPISYDTYGNIRFWGHKIHLLLFLIMDVILNAGISITQKYIKSSISDGFLTFYNKRYMSRIIKNFLATAKLIINLTFSVISISMILSQPIPFWIITTICLALISSSLYFLFKTVKLLPNIKKGY